MNNSDIIKQAALCGITEIGFADAEEFSKKKIISSSALVKSSEMTDVFSQMENAKSIIVYLTAYKTDCKAENLSCYACGEDYHSVCMQISKKICDYLESGGYRALAFTDNGPLGERALALEAGLGIRGENGFVINKKYGTYTFISYIITDCPLEKSQPLTGECLKCGKCIKACPGGALGETFSEEKCASFITQKKGELSEKEKTILKKANSAWGCDICQNVCPMNKNATQTKLKPFRENLISKLEKENISGREFKRKYSGRAFTWRGKAVIDRNLSILDEKQER